MKKKLFHITIYSFFVLLSSLLILEFLFRYQVIDFYQFEFKQLNPKSCQSDQAYLIFGDSYSAYPNGYLEQLRDLMPNSCFYNSAISGTGMKQHELLFERRVTDLQPQQILYQFCIDNDFMDIQHPTNYKDINPIKNLFWTVSGKLLVLQYFNYKFAPLSTLNQKESTGFQDFEFSREKYNPRTSTNYLASPNHIENCLYLKNGDQAIYLEWKEGFDKLVEALPESTILHLLIIPHTAQVNATYQNQMIELGGQFNEDLLQLDYPLYRQMQKDFPKVNFIDPLKAFRQADKEGKQLYFGNDPHLNPQGQKVLAQFIHEELMIWR